MTRILIAALFFGLGLSTSAFGHDVDMKEKMKSLGRSVGHVYACASDQDKTALKAQSAHVYSMTLHDLGPDSAYAYAVSVGIGASADVGKLDCAKEVMDWNKMKGKLGMAEAAR